MQAKEHKYTTFKITILLFLICLAYWGVLFVQASLPGDKMRAGLSFGIAEGSASVLCGVLCKFVKDRHCLVGATCSIILCSLSFYLFCGGHFTGTFAIVLNFMTVFSLGNLFCVFFTFVQNRVPSELLAGTISIAYSNSALSGPIAMFLAYLPQPFPTLGALVPACCILLLQRKIPETYPGISKPKEYDWESESTQSEFSKP